MEKKPRAVHLKDAIVFSVLVLYCAFFFAHLVSLGCTQILDGPPMGIHNICQTFDWRYVTQVVKLERCAVIVGNLFIRVEYSDEAFFNNSDISFPNLKEVTGYVAVYRVFGLRSLNQLFPNLTLIRGQELVRNYAFSVHSALDLIEIGLFDLLQISRGGVLIWNNPKLCFVETIDWDAIASSGRQVIAKSNSKCESREACRCLNFPDLGNCWSRKKCQRFINGPLAENGCHKECLGCRQTTFKCSRCRHYTDNNTCVSKCPDNKVILPQSLTCLTKEECLKLFSGKSWISNGICMQSCPKGFKYKPLPNSVNRNHGSCVVCHDCFNKTCPDPSEKFRPIDGIGISSMSAIYRYSHCVYVNGSLIVTLDTTTACMEELSNLKNIVEIRDYLSVSSSRGVTSLSFLENLKVIKGEKLYKGKYAIVIRDMKNLETLFSEKILKQLKIYNGTILAYNNPRLCMSEIENFHIQMHWNIGERFSISPTSNGYNGECQNINIPLNVISTTEQSAIATFTASRPKRNHKVSFDYTLHYREIPTDCNVNDLELPFYCTDRGWSISPNVKPNTTHSIVQNITKLKPSTTYAVYVEGTQTPLIFSEENMTDYARSKVINFTTVVGPPPPPFIVEIAAVSAHSFALNWLDHLKYVPHITRYLLDVHLINYNSKAIDFKNQCEHDFTLSERKLGNPSEVVVRNPPSDYGEICVCGNKHVLFREDNSSPFQRWKPSRVFGWQKNSFTPVLDTEYFNVCDEIDCRGSLEYDLLTNITIESVLQSMGVVVIAPQYHFKLEGLLPFHYYKLRLRACTGPTYEDCGTSAREIIRTQRIPENDLVRLRNAVLSTREFTLEWDPPVSPNGYVLAYFVQLKHTTTMTESCITRLQHEISNRTYRCTHKTPLYEYSVRVCISSMAVDRMCGEWVKTTDFNSLYYLLFGLLSIILVSVVVVLAVRWWCRRTIREDRDHLIENFELYPVESNPPHLTIGQDT